MEIPKGLCQCGCGQQTSIAKKSDSSRGNIKGEPLRFVRYHHRRGFPAENYDNEVNPSGLCLCGCGRPAPIAKQTYGERGIVQGQSCKYIVGHAMTGHARQESSNWKGGRYINTQGYVLIFAPEHSNSTCDGYVREHILIVEKALGKILPPEVEVHHVNGKKSDNRPENLVICQDRAYHFLLEQRTRAYKACGNAHWRKCWFCKQWDDPINMYVRPGRSVHRACANTYLRAFKKRRRTPHDAQPI